MRHDNKEAATSHRRTAWHGFMSRTANRNIVRHKILLGPAPLRAAALKLGLQLQARFPIVRALPQPAERVRVRIVLASSLRHDVEMADDHT